jgi:hypothetical protein
VELAAPVAEEGRAGRLAVPEVPRLAQEEVPASVGDPGRVAAVEPEDQAAGEAVLVKEGQAEEALPIAACVPACGPPRLRKAWALM